MLPPLGRNARLKTMDTERCLTTDRLRLHALARASLRELLEDRRTFEYRARVAVLPSLVDEAGVPAIRFKLEAMAQLPISLHPWMSYWLVVLEAQRVAVGLVGFKGPPNEDGEVEIGCGIVPTHRGMGVATEAASALLEWAFSHEACRMVVAKNVRSDNAASRRVFEKLGASVVERRQETVDFRIRRTAFHREPEGIRP